MADTHSGFHHSQVRIGWAQACRRKNNSVLMRCLTCVCNVCEIGDRVAIAINLRDDPSKRIGHILAASACAMILYPPTLFKHKQIKNTSLDRWPAYTDVIIITESRSSAARSFQAFIISPSAFKASNLTRPVTHSPRTQQSSQAI